MASYIPKVGRRPHLFLSHSSDDGEFALSLAKDLNICEVDVWIDKWEIEGGDSLYEKISEGLETSRYIALLITNSFLAKKWVSAEVRAAFSKDTDSENKIIIPLLLDEVTIPPLLIDKLYISFQQNYYAGLFQLAGIIHEISSKTIAMGLEKLNPKSIDDVYQLLKYSGKSPFMILPKDVFEEIAATGYAITSDNKLEFTPALLKNLHSLSERATDYVLQGKAVIDNYYKH